MGALVHIDSLGSLQSGLRRWERILEFLGFLRYDPRLVPLENGVNKHHANKGKKRGEKEFASLEIGLRVDGHGDQENSRTFSVATKGGGK
jgi:hypothetical protein